MHWRVNYLEDGLSAKYSKLMENNPQGAMLSLSEKIADSDTDIQKEEWATTYWNIALKAKHIPWLDRFRGIPLSLSFKFWKKRLLR